jgi:predicted amidohydrolase
MRISLFQYQIDPNDPARNLSRIEGAAREASSNQSDLLLLPELCLHGYNYRDFPRMNEWFLSAVNLSLQRICDRSHIDIAGTFVEQAGDTSYNTFAYFKQNSTTVLSYRKAHIFKQLGEGDHFTPGSEYPLLGEAPLPFAAAICYDIRFPEQFRALTAKGCQLFLVSAEWPAARVDHWRALLISRAIENQAFVVAVNCTGKVFHTDFAGNSIVIDPWGKVAAELGAEEGLLHVDISPEMVRDIRASFPVLADIRGDIKP